MIDDKTLLRLESKLDAMIRLLAAPQVKDMTVTEAADTLNRLGLDRDLIASICSTTPETVRVTLFNLRKKQGETKRRRQRVRSTENPEA